MKLSAPCRELLRIHCSACVGPTAMQAQSCGRARATCSQNTALFKCKKSHLFRCTSPPMHSSKFGTGHVSSHR